MTTPIRTTVALASLLAIATGVTTGESLPLAAERQEPTLAKPLTDAEGIQIVSPADGEIVSGPTLLRAKVEPSTVASNVVFYVDGRQVCTATRPPFECEWDAGATIAAHHVRLVVSLRSGGRAVRNIRTSAIAFAETVDVDAVQVAVTVTDGADRYVKGLPASAFHIKEDGRPQAIAQFYAQDAPLDLVVAVDMSASMRPALPTLKRAVSAFMAAVPARDRVTVLGFNDEVFPLVRRATDPAERLLAVERLGAWGSTVLYDAILRGIEMLGSRPGRKALVVFTDGEDQGSFAALEEVEQHLQESDLALYVIGLGQAVTYEPRRKMLDRLTDPTGGRTFATRSVDALGEAFGELLSELSSQYVLAYQPTNTTHDDTWRTITVAVDGYQHVRAREGYRSAKRQALNRP